MLAGIAKAVSAMHVPHLFSKNEKNRMKRSRCYISCHWNTDTTHHTKVAYKKWHYDVENYAFDYYFKKL